MSDKLEQWRDYARIALAGIRLFNGAAALFVPEWLVGRLGGDTKSSRTALYVLRLFGVRTIVVGLELLVPDEEVRTSALRYAIPIHASDTLSAALAGIQGQLPSRASIMLTAISGINTALAIFAQPPNVRRAAWKAAPTRGPESGV
jgi:hypothetical protein